MDYMKEYERWLSLAKGDSDVEAELTAIKGDSVKIERKIAVSYDSRIKSDLFSKVASGVFAVAFPML